MPYSKSKKKKTTLRDTISELHEITMKKLMESKMSPRKILASKKQK